jgi:hypothetical protein
MAIRKQGVDYYLFLGSKFPCKHLSDFMVQLWPPLSILPVSTMAKYMFRDQNAA